jgi:S-formylglutathione hydrolase FrmB
MVRGGRRWLVLLALAVVGLVAYLLIDSFHSRQHHGADIEQLSIESKAVGSTQRVEVVIPHGSDGRGRPLLVFLHGRHEHDDADVDLSEAMFKALRAQGDRAPVVAAPVGTGDSYWHDRRSGRWGSFVLDEVIPEVRRRFHTDPGRVAIGGISMGGFGAYDLMLHSRRRFCAVGGHSPALWQTGGETAAGAFDDAEDFARHDVVGAARSRPHAFARQPLWLDAGRQDPFDSGDRAFASALRSAGVRITVRRSDGGHTGDYWDRHWDEYMSWYSRRLAHCGAG